MVLAHALAIISHEFYYSAEIHPSFKRSLQLLIDEKKLSKLSQLVNKGVEKLLDLNPSEAFNDDKEALISLIESWRCFWCVFNSDSKYVKLNQKIEFLIDGVKSSLSVLQNVLSNINDDPTELVNVAMILASASISQGFKSKVNYFDENFFVQSKMSLQSLYRICLKIETYQKIINF